MSPRDRAILRRTWHAMIQRCHWPGHRAYRAYGGRGIGVCEEWLACFEAFASHMGPRPMGDYSIDRIDNARGYEPGNCRWATRDEQNLNRRGCVVIVHNGERVFLSQLAIKSGVNSDLALRRYREGWDPILAATTPKPRRLSRTNRPALEAASSAKGAR
jgi:hypothetical protein